MDKSDRGDAYTEVYAAEVLDRLDDCGCAHCSGCTDAGSCVQHADGAVATTKYLLANIRDVSTEHHSHLNAARCVRSFKQDVAEADLLGQEARAPFRAACSQLAAAALAVSAAAPPPEGKDSLEVGPPGIADACPPVDTTRLGLLKASMRTFERTVCRCITRRVLRRARRLPCSMQLTATKALRGVAWTTLCCGWHARLTPAARPPSALRWETTSFTGDARLV